jgi:predicted DNA-binding protein (MmcQ/YjbR family)
MNLESLRKFCLSMPGAMEDVKWGTDLCFSVGAKMFCVTGADSDAASMSFKCDPEAFAELTERPGIQPAAYVGRYGWVHVSADATIGDDELKELIRRSYQLVFDKLPSKLKKSVG